MQKISWSTQIMEIIKFKKALIETTAIKRLVVACRVLNKIMKHSSCHCVLNKCGMESYECWWCEEWLWKHHLNNIFSKEAIYEIWRRRQGVKINVLNIELITFSFLCNTLIPSSSNFCSSLSLCLYRFISHLWSIKSGISIH